MTGNLENSAAATELEKVSLHSNPKEMQCQTMFSEKAGLKLNIQKMKIMASGSITSWDIEGETMETVRDFIFLGSKIIEMVTAVMKLKDGCSLEEKPCPT